MATAVTDATFDQVISAPRAAVDFWSPSCPMCVQFKPVFEDVAAQMGGQIVMATANVDQDAVQHAVAFGIKALPTVIFFQNGKEVNRMEGGTSKEDFLAELSQVFSGGAPAAPVPAGQPVAVSGGGVPPAFYVLGGGIVLSGLLYWLLQKPKA